MLRGAPLAAAAPSSRGPVLAAPPPGSAAAMEYIWGAPAPEPEPEPQPHGAGGEAGNVANMESDLMTLLSQLQAAQTAQHELQAELTASRQREDEAKVSAEQSYALVTEVQEKVREQIDAIAEEHAAKTRTAEEAAARAEAEVAAAGGADGAVALLQGELREAQAALSAALSTQQAAPGAATAGSADQEGAQVAELEAALAAARGEVAEAKRAADERVAIAMSSAVMAEQGKSEVEHALADRLEAARQEALAAARLEQEAAVGAVAEQRDAAEAALVRCRTEAHDQVAEAQMEMAERVDATEKQLAGAMERAAAAEGRVSSLLLQAAGDADRIESLQERLRMAEQQAALLGSAPGAPSPALLPCALSAFRSPCSHLEASNSAATTTARAPESHGEPFAVSSQVRRRRWMWRRQTRVCRRRRRDGGWRRPTDGRSCSATPGAPSHPMAPRAVPLCAVPLRCGATRSPPAWTALCLSPDVLPGVAAVRWRWSVRRASPTTASTAR